jgi:hypothetical protein
MVTFPQVGRVLALSNFSSIKLDTVGRQLRDAGMLVVRGRGSSAAHLEPVDLGRILIAYGGAGKGVRAAERLAKLQELQADTDALTLLKAVTKLISDAAIPDDFVELRISRVRQRARLIYQDRVITFTRNGRPLKHGRLEVEASLDAAVFNLVHGLLADATPQLIESDEDEDGD